jgi:hypothetical protein
MLEIVGKLGGEAVDRYAVGHPVHARRALRACRRAGIVTEFAPRALTGAGALHVQRAMYLSHSGVDGFFG